MHSLIEKFYAGSPMRRIITVVTWLLIISAAMAIYSFITLASHLKGLNESNAPYKTTGIENIPASRGYTFVDAPLKEALNGWKMLAGFSETVMIESSAGKPNRLGDKVAEHDQEIISAIRSFGSLDWKYLLIFASPQTDPLTDELAENFKKARKVSRFIAIYHRRFKQLHPEENSSFIFAAQVKLARINDLISPFLIGKMITIAMDGIAMKQLTNLLNRNLISDAEAGDYIELLKDSIAFDKPIKTAMEDEFIFFKHAYGRFYARAPLAMWILDKFYGDPCEQYQKTSREMFENPDYKLELDFVSHNPLLVLAFPNFRKANTVSKERACQKAIMLATLAARLGKESGAIDLFSGEAFKSMQKDNKTVFYSVGPNKSDENGTGDDILLPEITPDLDL